MSPDRDNWETWLTEHPEAKDDFADLPRLRELYQSICPPEPDDAAWNAVQARIHESISRGQSERTSSRRPLWAILGLTAAAAILSLLLARSLWPTRAPTPGVEEPFPVAEADEVTIISMDARDVAALVVGEPPVGGELEFARPEDIRVIRCERCPHSGRMARLEQDGEVPMFVTAAVEPTNDD